MTTSRDQHGRIFDDLRGEFSHPALLLWRSIEVGTVCRVLESLETRDPILDIGCAEGTISTIVFPERRIIGVDPWLAALEKVRMARFCIFPVGADARFLPIGSGTIGTIFSNSVIEHIPDLSSLLAEVRRVLTPGGLLLFTVPTAGLTTHYAPAWLLARTPLRGLGQRYAGARNRQLEHRNLLTQAGWEEALAAHGLRLDAYVPYLTGRHVRLWDILAAVGWGLRPLQPLRFVRSIAMALTQTHAHPYIRRQITDALSRPLATQDDHACAVIVARPSEGTYSPVLVSE